MCIGVPMQVIRPESGYAICEAAGERREIDMRLVGDQPEGTWVLVFLDAAREVVTSEQALLIGSALDALRLALGGKTEDIDHLFPDLAGREPELPPHLKIQLPPSRKDSADVDATH
ncbi:HypC/HybG/HupF family hydrogenase formation chaperone [Bradyrhizobium sp. AUGA SZCCT0283]|uniref:HypC/HybG/HupF family hydrogenase formation chaperone n=1 Tax=Bradyrhizobium sp. AUGA SZCCT0283 TaxID=2807671 RepID=UPI001BAA7F19|nr:HypC/HybG/HupF family hydrogenase formation chaperone [Bradyrhizobium sp. AUGA SZCCT0283]MBR1279739.1 HypC/HybG/HupF family hydrogenase formation chaperone [Bradyrhizobium sp. AUGA SZCCT0283]